MPTSEQLSGPAQAEANAAASIAAREAEQQAARLYNADAYELNAQIDANANRAATLNATEQRRNSPEAIAANRDMDIVISGSRGRTEGYVDEAGQPLTAPIEGEVDRIRDAKGVEERRVSLRYGVKEADRQKVADKYEAKQKEKAEGYLEDVDELLAEGFDLTQVKLILDLRQTWRAQELKLLNGFFEAGRRANGPPKDDKAAKEALSNAARRAYIHMREAGDDEVLLKRIIRQEGLLDQKEYEKFRYRWGNPEKGESKKFTAYRDHYLAEVRSNITTANRERQLAHMERRGEPGVGDPARRPEAQAARTAAAGSEQGNDTPEPAYKTIEYDVDEYGMKRIGLEYSEKGTEIKSDGEAKLDPTIICTEENEQGSANYYYAPNGLQGDVIDVGRSVMENRIVYLPRGNNNEEPYPPVVIGEKWMVGDQEIDPVGDVQVSLAVLQDGQIPHESYEQRGMDTFAKLDEMIRAIREAEAAAADPAPAQENGADPVNPDQFTADQSYISWFREHRAPGLKKLLKARQLGAFLTAGAVVALDYGVGTEIYDNTVKPYVDALPEDPDREPAIKRILGAIANVKAKMNKKTAQMAEAAMAAGSRTAERAGNFTRKVDYLGNVALIKTAEYAAVTWDYMSLPERLRREQAELEEQQASGEQRPDDEDTLR
ncbi:MAG TPA: hypothetical protein VN554_02155 [Verrucomicrobiae bacterium]|nr:hypothetical protein [Verrucomicrobiae bacterium]